MESAVRIGSLARQRRGALLIEAMLAVAIFALAVIPLSRGLNSSAQRATEARHASQVTRVMENLLQEAMHMVEMEEGEWFLIDPERGLSFSTRIYEEEVLNQDGEVLDGIFTVEISAERQRGQGMEPDRWQIRALAYPPLYGAAR